MRQPSLTVRIKDLSELRMTPGPGSEALYSHV